MKKNKKILILSLVVVAAVLLLNHPIAAEVGNSGGFGGGGSSSGGGSSWGGSGGGSSFMFLGGSPILFFIFLAFVLFMKYNQSKNGNTNNRSNYSGHNYNTGISEESVISQVKEKDPNFSAEKFRGYVGELYITLQEAWEAKDWRAVRPFESNALFNMHNRQLQEHIDKNWTNHLDMQDVRQVKLAGYRVDGDQEVLTVQLHAFCIDYTIDDNTGKLIDGNKTALQERYYRFEFIRTLGVQTDVDTGLNPTNCPNCGAPTQVTSSGECEYCHSIITNGKYGWVLNKYGAW